MTGARPCALPALGAGAALSAMLFASRLPVTLDFILPRRPGWPLFAFGFEALSRPAPRAAFTAAVCLIFLAAMARFGWLAASAMRGRAWSARDFLTRGFYLALAVFLLRWSFTIWFEISQKVWFPYASLNPLEPFANLLASSAIILAAMSAALAVLSPQRTEIRVMLPWAGTNALAAALAMSLHGAWLPSPAPDAGRRLFVILTEDEGRPGQAAYDLPIKEATAPPSGVGRLEGLRELYETRAKLMDPTGLRSALMLGVKHGDELARTLLLAHLGAAPPSPEALGALGALADETAHRVGAIGASRIALAYAHLGDAAQASVWAKRGEERPRGIPAGLLDLGGGGALKPGRISGKIAGVRPLKVALYRKSDPLAPYLLDAGALTASTELDEKGRFSFTGLSAGRYYLAFAFEAATDAPRVSGHRGDMRLDSRRAALDAGTLTIKAASR